MRIINVVGARPNFMKIAPLMRAYGAHPSIEPVLVHTGQHYDRQMSGSFFEELGIPHPDIDLGIGSGTHAEQVGRTMVAFEKVLLKRPADWVVVVGDVNATIACSITAKKCHVRVAHIEAGLRSRDLDMPEEINRIVTDRLSDLLFTTDELSRENLRAEGVPDDRIHLVGNIMIDTLTANRSRAEGLDPNVIAAGNRKGIPNPPALPTLSDGAFGVVTMHRPSNVDDPETLTALVRFLADEVAPGLPLVWPIHPRTWSRLEALGLADSLARTPGLVLLEPVGYLDMLRLNMGARVMFTDSGGLQEECCVLGTPCLTMRWNTERPVTLAEHGGASYLVGNDVDKIRKAYASVCSRAPEPHQPPLWDGKTAERIAEILSSEAGRGPASSDRRN